MNANGRELVEKELTYRVVGCAMAVLNELGHGLREKTYERALCIELRHQGLAFQPTVAIPVQGRPGIHWSAQEFQSALQPL